MTAGLTSAIMDTRTPQIVEAVKAADLLLGHDEWGGGWIAAHRARQAPGRVPVTESGFSIADWPRRPIEPPVADPQPRRHRPGPARLHRRHRT